MIVSVMRRVTVTKKGYLTVALPSSFLPIFDDGVHKDVLLVYDNKAMMKGIKLKVVV